MFEVAGVQFHAYGLLVGLGASVAYWLSYRVISRLSLSLKDFDRAVMWMIVGGILGARIWHVFSDWPLYAGNWLAAVYIWQGGLSIIGAVAGSVTAVWLWQKYSSHGTISVGAVLDAVAFGAPFGQAVGRLGNYLNQELYGVPTHLPWGIAISPENRVAQYQDATHFHPLFAYEAGLLLAFGVWLWHWGYTRWQFGSGKFFAVYLGVYAGIRFGLEFLRVQQPAVQLAGMGINQILMVFLVVGVGIWWRKNVHVKP